MPRVPATLAHTLSDTFGSPSLGCPPHQGAFQHPVPPKTRDTTAHQGHISPEFQRRPRAGAQDKLSPERAEPRTSRAQAALPARVPTESGGASAAPAATPVVPRLTQDESPAPSPVGSTARRSVTLVRTVRSPRSVPWCPPPGPRYRVRDSARRPAPTAAAVAIPAPPAVALTRDWVAGPATSPRCLALAAPARKATRRVRPIQMKTAIQIWRKALRLDAVLRRQTNGKARERGRGGT